jgi:serpin B
MRVVPFIFFFALLLAMGCPQSMAQEGEGFPPQPEGARPEAAEPEAAEPEAPPQADDAALGLSRAYNGLALELGKDLAAGDGNFFYSPLSVTSALAMTYAGARGETAAEFEAALKYPLKGDGLLAAQKRLSDAILGSTEEGSEFTVANSLWPDSQVRILESFLSSQDANFGPQIFQVDYQNDEPKARAAINDWVDKATKGKITDLIANPLPASTRLILANAVYFKGAWRAPFPPEGTKDRDFAAPKGKVSVPFMHKEAHFNYLERPGFQALELLYRGNNTSMVVLLPKKGGGGLADLWGPLAAGGLSGWLDGLSSETVDVYLPKFKITWGARSLREPLEALGLRQVFTDQADLSGITGDRSLSVSDVVHKAFVEVNEEGTEAAAATAVIARATAMRVDEKPIPVFDADRPFVFLIIDKATGSILFMGKLDDPSQ